MKWKSQKGLKILKNPCRSVILSLCNCVVKTNLLSFRLNHSFASDVIELCSSFQSSSSCPYALHSIAIKNGSIHESSITGNYILDFYVKRRQFVNARQLFDEIPERDVRSWTILISALSRFGYYCMGIDYFSWMLVEGIVEPNKYTLASVLKCCGGATKGLQVGKAVHGCILRKNIALDVALENALLDLYVKSEAFNYAQRWFQMMDEKNKDAVSWNIMLSAKLRTGDMDNCLNFFKSMPIKEASSWNTIINGCIQQQGFEFVALKLLYDMVNSGFALNKFTFSTTLVLISTLRCLRLGQQVHGQLLRVGVFDDLFVRASLVDMYCKCRHIKKADSIRKTLDNEIRQKHWSMVSVDEVSAQCISWSALIAGYVDNGRLEDALENFGLMICEGIEVNMVTLTSIVTVCANSQLLELGQQIHARFQKFGYKPDTTFCSSIIDMYAKCGKLEDSRAFFDESRTHNVFQWTTMISSYAIHGCGEEAIKLFELMQHENVIPNEVTFTGLLTACSHSGLIQEGLKYFTMMTRVFAIEPEVQHLTCMVDLYGRAGLLNEIKNFIFENEILYVVPVWTAFLFYCQLHNNIKMAKWVSEKLLKLEPEPTRGGSYILLRKTYLESNDWGEACNIRKLMQERKVYNFQGKSWI